MKYVNQRVDVFQISTLFRNRRRVYAPELHNIGVSQLRVVLLIWQIKLEN